MRCPTLSELPPPPPGKTGWPWTEESPELPDTMPDGRPWPRVSIVTPSYNQAQFIEETIRSVLLQGYPDLEYMIIDGGSTDGSVDIIRKYEPWLAYWVSEKDRGQSHAINKGWERATGEIVAWLNSDDTYEPGALGQVAESFQRMPCLDLLYSECNFIDENSLITGQSSYGAFDRGAFAVRDRIPQPTAFVRTEKLRQVGLLDEELNYAMDYDLWLRIAVDGMVVQHPRVLANVRYHQACKSRSSTRMFLPEVIRVYDRFFARGDLPEEFRKAQKRSVREACWRAATSFYRVNQPKLARHYAVRAYSEGSLMEDLHFAVQQLLYDECSLQSDEFSEPKWILAVCRGLSAAGLNVSKLERLAVRTWLETTVFRAFQQAQYKEVLRFYLRLLVHDLRALQNRGLLRIALQSFLRELKVKS